MKKYLKDRENKIAFVFFLITMIVATGPLISRYCISGHDIEYHLLRIESLKEGILTGHPFAKVNTFFFGGAGYASSMFYSDLLMHIPALLRVFHVSIGKSFHIYTALIFVLGYISTFYCTWKMTLSKNAATVAAILFTLCPYHMDDLLVRTACGESTAFIFLPFAIYGMFNVVCEQMDKPWVIGFGFAGLLLSHPATFLLTFVLAVFIFAVNFKVFVKDPAVFVRLCLVAFLAAMVTAFFWLPMLEQFADARFYVSNNWSDLLDSAVGFSDIASQTFPCVGLVLFALMLPRVFLSRKDYPILRFADLMLIAALVFAAGATSVMPWERVAKLFGFLQFPWRMFIETSVILAIYDAIVLKLFTRRIADGKAAVVNDIVILGVFVFAACLAITHHGETAMGYYDYSDDYYSFKPFTANVIAGEWLPQTVKDPQALVDESSRMTYDDGTTVEFTREKGVITSEIRAGHRYVDVPFIFYKGYSAVLFSDGEKEKLEITGEGNNGMCRVFLDKKAGELTVRYTGTILQYVSYVLSGLFLLLVLDLVYLKNKYKKKLRQRAAAAGADLGQISCIAFVLVLSLLLSGCGSVQVNIDEKKGFSDPENMIEYLKNANDDEIEWQDEYNDLFTVNVSQKGYDSKYKGYAIAIDETSGEQVIYVLTCDEASRLIGDEIPEKDGLCNELLEKEITEVQENYRTDSLKERIMHETDALLCMEVFPDSPRAGQIKALAASLAGDLLDIPAGKITESVDRYNYAAALAKAAYVLDDWGRAEEAWKVSEQFFMEAESEGDAAEEPAGSRMWAASELYRLTGLKTYRAVADSIAMDVVPKGFTYEDPGYFGVFAYLMCSNQTNMNVSNAMMKVVFDEANSLIKEDIEKEFIDTRVDDETFSLEEKKVETMFDEVYLVTMTDYVSMSVEYREFAADRLYYIFGANLSGADHTLPDNVLGDAPKLFIYSSLCR